MSAAGRHRLLLGGLSLLLVGAAIAATFTQAPGHVVADARYEHVAAPGQFLARHATVWDDERTLGQTQRYFSPAVGAYQAGLERLGSPPWVIQRGTHALLLAGAAIGTLLLARALVSEPVAWAAAGFLFAFNPYSSQFLVPSGLFTAYALAPWMALAAVRGVRHGSDRWRWGAVFALAVFCAGMLNTSSLLLAMIPAGVLGLLQVSTGAADWRGVRAWAWRGLVLSVGVSAAMLVVLFLLSDVINVNLVTTETPETVASTTSASESWRGLGQWLSYFRFGGDQLRDQATPFFTNPLVIVAGFVPLASAAHAAVRARSRQFAGLLALAAVSVVLMVGIHPVGDPSPFGRLLGEGFDSSLFVRGFRSMYKAGAGLQLAVGVLAGAGLAALVRAPKRELRLVGLVAVPAVVAAAFPFWTGELYNSSERHEDIPEYWEEAFAWFAEQPREPGVLVLPSLARTTYRWGFVNDTLLDANLPQPAVSARTLPQSTDVLADLTEWIDEYAAGTGARPGALAPVLDRIGVRWVLIQNDLSWFEAGVPRPAHFDAIRSDPAFRLAASFGNRGENIVGPVAFDQTAVNEARLRPVEVYELVDARPAGAGVESAGIVVAGAGEAWPSLARGGWLDSPVVVVGDPATEAALDEIRRADALVFTDGAQRRAARVAGFQSHRSHLLRLAEDVDRPVQTLHDEVAGQTVAEIASVASVEATDWGRSGGVWQGGFRPANAIDGNTETAWATDAAGSHAIEVALAEPTGVEELAITLATPVSEAIGDAAEVAALRVETHVGGEPVDTVVVEAPSSAPIGVALSGSPIDSLVVTLDRAEESFGLIGVAELVLADPEPIDTREVLRVPGPATDEGSARLVEALAETPVHHVFTRNVAASGVPEFALINRKFWSPGGEVELAATVRVDDTTSDAVLDALIDSPVGALASARFGGAIEATARNVLDGDFSTAWQFDPDRDAELTVTVPTLPGDQIELWLLTGSSSGTPRSRLTEVMIAAEDIEGERETWELELGSEPVCDEAFARIGDDVCVERVTVDFEPRVLVSLTVTPLEVDRVTSFSGTAPVQVADVRLRWGGADVLVGPLLEPSADCIELFELDGAPVPMRASRSLTLEALVDGTPFLGCSPATLSPGWHRLMGATRGSHAVETMALSPVGSPAVPESDRRPVETVTRTSTSRSLVAHVEAGDIVVTDVPAHRGWDVSTSGVPGARLVADGFVAWRADRAGTVTIDLDFGPQRRYKIAWFITAISLAVCAWLVVSPRRDAV